MLRRWAMVCAVALLPAFAGAVEPMPADWTKCVTDYDCTVVKGPCHPEAVNRGIEDQATAFYAKQKATIKCVKEFWEPTQDGADARCRLERCEIVGK